MDKRKQKPKRKPIKRTDVKRWGRYVMGLTVAVGFLGALSDFAGFHDLAMLCLGSLIAGVLSLGMLAEEVL